MKLKFKNDAYTGRVGDEIKYLIVPNRAGYAVHVEDDGYFHRVENEWFDTKTEAIAYCVKRHGGGAGEKSE